MNNNIETVIDTNLIIAEALENDEYETTYEEGEEVEAQTEAPTKQENFFYRTFGVHDPFNAAFLIIIFLIIQYSMTDRVFLTGIEQSQVDAVKANCPNIDYYINCNYNFKVCR